MHGKEWNSSHSKGKNWKHRHYCYPFASLIYQQPHYPHVQEHQTIRVCRIGAKQYNERNGCFFGIKGTYPTSQLNLPARGLILVFARDDILFKLDWTRGRTRPYSSPLASGGNPCGFHSLRKAPLSVTHQIHSSQNQASGKCWCKTNAMYFMQCFKSLKL